MGKLKMNPPRFAELRNFCAGRYAANERQRWDALHAHPNGSWFLRNCYAEGLHDEHIASALRVAIKPHPDCTCSDANKPAPGVLWICTCFEDAHGLPRRLT